MVLTSANRATKTLSEIYSETNDRKILSDLFLYLRRRLHNLSRHQDIAKADKESNESLCRLFRCFLVEAWDALDGTGRIINCALFPQYPDSNLVSPAEIGHDCTFYTVRRSLQQISELDDNPLCTYIWNETRGKNVEEYEELSFYYNMAQFLPTPVVRENKLPGWEELPEHMKSVVGHQKVESSSVIKCVESITSWETMFIDNCLDMISNISEPR